MREMMARSLGNILFCRTDYIDYIGEKSSFYDSPIAGDDEIETTQVQAEKTTPKQFNGQELQQQMPITGAEKSIKPSETTSKPFSRVQAKVKIIPEGRKGQLNIQYLATLPGILKLAEMILGFVAFILAICADRKSTSSAWTEHITFETTIIVSVLILLYVVFPHLTLLDERTREGLVVVELIFYGLNALFFFFGIWLMVHLAASITAEGKGAAIMNAILCFALCVLYGMETYIKFKMWNKKSMTQNKRTHEKHQIPPAPTHQSQITIGNPSLDQKEHVGV